ncbi:putative transporter [Colletotrichum sp. SAR11_59]|nr:putative transporter [Colletotrichum sp. SAR11_59]
MTRDRGLEEDNPNEKIVHTSNDGTPLDVKPSDNGNGQGRHEHAVSKDEVDDTTLFYNLNKEKAGSFTAEMESKLVRKNFWFLLGQTWWIAFLIHLDKSTLSQASTMGIFKDVDMTKKQYNDLFVVFYTGYLIALWPGAWLSQRTGQKQFIVGSLLLWALLLAMHTESQIVPSTTILHQAFFSPKKSPWVQLLWWASGSFANVLLTMVAYKLILLDDAHTLIGGLSSWKWLHIICVILTFIMAVPLAFFLPNSPVEAKWLSTAEKLAAPWSNKIALVVGTQISTFKPSYLLGLSWAGTATTGYTKKLTVMSTCVVAASAANMISPEFWQPKYKPRYTLPWAFMTAFWFISPAMCLVIRWYLVRENRRRQATLDADGSSDDNDVLDTGNRVVHVYKEDLDLTDRQNQKFIYPL